MLLTLTKNFDDSKRDSPFYGRFQYVARYFLREASCLRTLNHEDIDKTLSYRSSWKWKEITPEVIQRVHTACDDLLAIADPHKITVTGNWIYFYTNTLTDIQQLSNGVMSQKGPIGRAVITHDKGTIGHKNPKFKFRTYFHSHRPTADQVLQLNNFVSNCQSEIGISPGLRDWLNQKNPLWIMDHYYIDHNDMKFVTMMALVNPKLVRKTKPIVQINN